MWVNAIGRNFQPKKSYYICSAHFVAADFMVRPNASGIRLNNLAVPSIFFDLPTVPTNVTPAIESDSSSAIKPDTIPAIFLVIPENKNKNENLRPGIFSRFFLNINFCQQATKINKINTV